MAPNESAPRLTPVALQILLVLSENDLHGYGIKQEIERRTDRAMNLGSGTLYEAIQRLERDGLIAEAAPPRDAPAGRRPRRYYRLRPEGTRALQAELLKLEKIVRYAKDQKLIPETR